MQQNLKKYLVLGVLFILPITAYIFFSLSTNHFKTLPILSENITELHGFTTLDGTSVQLEDRITVLGFFGEDLEVLRAYAYNFAHIIYSNNHSYNDLQF